MIFALPAIAPCALALAAFAAFCGPGQRPRATLVVAQGAGILALLSSTAAVLLLVTRGAGESRCIGVDPFCLALRLDAVGATMLLLVSFVGLVVVRYAATYLDGEARQGAFTGWLCLTLACVLLLVQSGSLFQFAAAWIATSLCLHRLLLFYPDRIQARRAARKKFITARIGDAALILAFVLLFLSYRTGQIGKILSDAGQGHASLAAVVSASMLGIAALLKSAQFPTHGWLTEVMETPTPVSALLHAGVINAGGFLLIRFADVMLLAPGVLAALALIGGFTALFAALVMLTQPAVKTSLAWSTVAQMGFMILECGLGQFALALLHIVAHSLYKAHAFLSSGDAVQRVASIARPGPAAIPHAAAVVRAMLLALLIYGAIGALAGFSHKSAQAIALGAILVFGVAYLLAQGLADQAPRALAWRTLAASTAAAAGYFVLQTLAELAMRDALPPAPVPGALEWAVIVLTVISFGGAALAQALLPLWADHPAAAGLRVHLANGFYANAVFDRLIDGWARPRMTHRHGMQEVGQ